MDLYHRLRERIRLPRITKFGAIVCIGVCWLVLLICAMLCFALETTFWLKGFGVTSTGDMYIGRRNSVICIDSEGQIHPVDFLDRYTSRGFFVSVTSEDKIELYAGEYHLFSLEGELLLEDDSIGHYHRMQWQRQVTTGTGERYWITYILGRYKIYKEVDGDHVLVYQMPLGEYLAKLLFFTTIAVCIFCVAWLHHQGYIVIRGLPPSKLWKRE